MKYLDHDFNKYGYLDCQRCGYGLVTLEWYKYTCAEILNKSKTHKWAENEVGDFLLGYCEICKISGRLTNSGYIIEGLSRFYSCNEYLMIRANS